MALKMMVMMSQIMAALAAAVLISPILFSGGGSLLVLLPKADAATTYDITTNTTWGDKQLNSGDVVNIANEADLTITGTVTGGNFNVHGSLSIYTTGVLNIDDGGTIVDSNAVYVNGVLNINSGGTLKVDSGAVTVNSGGTLSVSGKVENFNVMQIDTGGVLRINNPGIFHNNPNADLTRIFGTLNVNNGGKLDNDDLIRIYDGGTLKVFTGGTLDNSGGTIYKFCGGTFTLNPGASFGGNPITGDACIVINNVPLPEGNSGTKNFPFKVTRSGITTGTTTLNYATSAGTASAAGNDYIAKSRTLTFTAGQTSKTVNIVVKGDTVKEPNETFRVNLSNCNNGCVIVDNKGVGTIQNDD